MLNKELSKEELQSKLISLKNEVTEIEKLLISEEHKIKLTNLYNIYVGNYYKLLYNNDYIYVVNVIEKYGRFQIVGIILNQDFDDEGNIISSGGSIDYINENDIKNKITKEEYILKSNNIINFIKSINPNG